MAVVRYSIAAVAPVVVDIVHGYIDQVARHPNYFANHLYERNNKLLIFHFAFLLSLLYDYLPYTWGRCPYGEGG